MAVVVHVQHVEGEDLVLMARPEAGGETLTRAEIPNLSATLRVFDPQSATPNTAVEEKVLSSTADPDGSDNECMFSSLQTDDTWGPEGGYTFWAAVRNSEYHLEGGKHYRVEVCFEGAGHTGAVWPQRENYGKLTFIWHVHVVPAAAA